MPSDLVWAGLLLAGGLYELHTILTHAEGDTLSEKTRRVFRVHTRPGKLIFLLAWGFFAAWFAVHIVGGNI